MMTYNERKDYPSIIQEVSDAFLGFIGDELPERIETYTAKINDTVLPLLDVGKPKVMVYGIYNSGKSTIINALMKKEVAEMADRPMTDSISEYDHGDYILIDSPGVDAPIVHEMITDEFLNKCHIILFVISSKGGFESIANYQKMASLIKKEIPFVIVLNERGYQIAETSSPEEKELRKAEHEQELKEIQYKIYENLKKITKDKDIADKYEVYIVNAKKALTGALKNKEKLYENSKIGVLDRRIVQLMQSGDVLTVLKQPIINLKHVFDDTEQYIIETLQSNSSVDYASKIETLRKKEANFKEEMRILIRNATNRRLDEITSLYIGGSPETEEGIEYEIFQEIEDQYKAKMTGVITYVQNNFSDIAEISESITYDNYLEMLNQKSKDYDQRNFSETKRSAVNDSTLEVPSAPKEGFFDLFKSKKRKEREKRERMEREADLINSRNQQRLNEMIRARQEARQVASSDMVELQTALISTVNQCSAQIFQTVISAIQMIDNDSKEEQESAARKLYELSTYRRKIEEVEDALF